MSVTSETSSGNLTDLAIGALRADILACHLAPGATLSEAALAGRFSLGRAPIRAALARLGDEGLVQAVPRRGWVVSLVTIRDIHEVFDLRLILEPEAARRAAQAMQNGRATPARRRALDAIPTPDIAPGTPEAALRFLAYVSAFHAAIAAFAGNQRLARHIGRLLDESARMLMLGLAHRDRTGEMADEHGALIAAIAAGDAPESAAIMCELVAASRSMVLAALTGPMSALVVSEVA